MERLYKPLFSQNISIRDVWQGPEYGFIVFLAKQVAFVSFTSIHDSQDNRGRGGGISFTPLYHLQMLNRHFLVCKVQHFG